MSVTAEVAKEREHRGTPRGQPLAPQVPFQPALPCHLRRACAQPVAHRRPRVAQPLCVPACLALLSRAGGILLHLWCVASASAATI